MRKYSKTLEILPILCLILPITACKAKQDSGESDPLRDTAAAVVTVPTAPPIPTLEYREEWTKAGGLSEFRTRLLEALKTGGQAAILASVSETLEINPGTTPGPQGFIETWGLDGAAEKLAPLRALLQDLLGNGGCIEVDGSDTSFSAPYYACQSDSMKAGCDEPGCGITDRDGATLFEVPDSKGKTLGDLAGNEIIPSLVDTLCTEDFSRCEWRKVSRRTGQMGFVPVEKIRRISDGYLWLVREETGWKIRVLRGPGIPYNDN